MLRTALQLTKQARRVQGLSPYLWAAESQSASPAALSALNTSFDACSCQRHYADVAEVEEVDDYVPLPTQVYGLAGKYAAALYTAGFKADLLDEIEDDLIDVWNTAADSENFRKFLKDPSIPKKEKAASLDAILKDLEIGDLTRNFFGVLAENNRLHEIVRITNAFETLLAADRGEVTATITTATALQPQDLDEIKSGLTSVLEEGDTLIVQQKVDPAIIGGVIIDVGDKHIDLSIQSRVKRIQQLIIETV
ncbi:hypothetical protein WJX73_006159 [Symbiochloris irregularis]|uniref:ATP synthase subunit 5, mitochondrial n=1 Tax=Symbiochloris irregularis TaxID=706552 RepID=A0AAW1NXA6_9CHLO